MSRQVSDRVLDLHSAFRSFGYFMAADPIEGQEDTFVSSMREGLATIRARLDANAKRYGYRGKSKAALAALHRDLPVPVWGVEVIEA